ncbi:MAG TPA: DUF3240 family protein [Methylotenera sp.]|nr:DUF3240 family protein [Methylotenera sp.]
MSETEIRHNESDNPSEQNPCLVMLFATPALEESLVDWLLENESISGFSTTESYGHGQRASSMSLFEQVTGRQRRIQFLIEINEGLVGSLLNALKANFPGLHFMVIPVLSAGRL